MAAAASAAAAAPMAGECAFKACGQGCYGKEAEGNQGRHDQFASMEHVVIPSLQTATKLCRIGSLLAPGGFPSGVLQQPGQII
jgi:hypothetical protein